MAAEVRPCCGFFGTLLFHTVVVTQSTKTAGRILLLHLSFLEGNRTPPFSMAEAEAVAVERGFLVCHKWKGIKEEGFICILAASFLLYG